MKKVVVAMVAVLCVASLDAEDRTRVARIVGFERGEEVLVPSDDRVSVMSDKRLEDWITYYDDAPAWLTWAMVERATYFDMTDFPAVQYPFHIKRLETTFFEHGDHLWPSDQFRFKIYGDDGTTLLYESLILAANRFPTVTEYDLGADSIEITAGGFWVSVKPIDASGHPSCLADGAHEGQSFYDSLGTGNWTPWDHGEFSRYAYLAWEPLAEDVGVISAVSPPGGIWVGTMYPVACVVQNVGTGIETFDVECIITDAGGTPIYTDIQTVTGLTPGASQTVNFIDWTPILYNEAYQVRFTSLLTGDMNLHNDTLITTSISYERGEIAYDDFSAEAWWIVAAPSGPSDCFATRFTPYLTPPFYVTEGKVFVNDTSPWFDYIGLFPDLGGSPDIDNPYQIIEDPQATEAPGWIVVQFDTLLTRMDAPTDLWLVAKFLPDSTGPGIGSDETPPVDMRSFWTSDMSVWNPVTDGDYLIRIVHRLPPVDWDASVISIDEPGDIVAPETPLSPQATVRNYGDSTATFNVICNIELAETVVYTDTVLVTGLVTDAVEHVTFDVWTPGLAGNLYTITVFTTLTDDMNPLNDTLSITTRVAGGDYLVWDPDPNHSSGPVIDSILGELGYTGHYTQDISLHYGFLSQYDAMFISVGQFGNKYLLAAGSAEVDSILAYVAGGGRLYLEGGDVWHIDPGEGGHDFRPLFGITGGGDGPTTLTDVTGVPGTITEGMSFTYIGESRFSNFVLPDGATMAFTNQDGQYIGHYHTPGAYTTFGFSGELAGLEDAGGLSTRSQLLQKIMALFAIGIEEDLDVVTKFSVGWAPTVFNSKTVLAYQVPSRSMVSVKIYDITGRLVRDLMKIERTAGTYTASWDGKDDKGSNVASGVYFYRFEAGNFSQSGKLILLR